MKQTPAYLGIDIETTGLSVYEDCILEIVAIPLDKNLNELADPFHHIVPHQAPWKLMDRVVLNMHVKNGLIDEIEHERERLIGLRDSFADKNTGPWDLHGILDAGLDMYIYQNWPADLKPRSISLFGASVHFDKSFVNARCPKTSKLLSHRVYDVSSLKMLATDQLDMEFPKAEAHRALADIRESIAQGKMILERVTALRRNSGPY